MYPPVARLAVHKGTPRVQGVYSARAARSPAARIFDGGSSLAGIRPTVEGIHRLHEDRGRLLAVPRAELQRRLDAYREQAAQNPNKRGPKPKVK